MNNYNLEIKYKDLLTFIVHDRLYSHCQKINTKNSKEQKSIKKSVRFAYR